MHSIKAKDDPVRLFLSGINIDKYNHQCFVTKLAKKIAMT